MKSTADTTTTDYRQEFAKRMQDLEEHRGLPQPQRIITQELNFTEKHPLHTHTHSYCIALFVPTDLYLSIFETLLTYYVQTTVL